MSSKIKSIGAHEKFNHKVVKFLKKLGATSTNNQNYPDQYLIETIAGPLKVTLFPAHESAVFSIVSKFMNLEKANELNQAHRLPFNNNFNTYSGKWNFMHTLDKRTFEDFTSSVKKIHAPGIDVTFTVRLKSEKAPEFLEGLGKGVVYKQTVTYKVTEEEFKSPMCQSNIQDMAEQLLREHFEVVLELGDKTKNIPSNSTKEK